MGWKFSKMEPLSQVDQAHQNLSKVIKWTRYFVVVVFPTSFCMASFFSLPFLTSLSSKLTAKWLLRWQHLQSSLKISPNYTSFLYLWFLWSDFFFPFKTASKKVSDIAGSHFCGVLRMHLLFFPSILSPPLPILSFPTPSAWAHSSY